MKRILIFSLSYTPFVGGAELALKEITNRIDPSKYSFDLITLRFDRNLPRIEKLGNITVHRVGFSVAGAKISDRSMPLLCKIAKVLFPFTAYLKALSLHRARRFDLIWALLANQAGFAALFFKATHPQIPYLLELQDGRAFADMKSRRPILYLFFPLYRQLYKAADRIKVISRFIEHEVRALGYRKVVAIIPNGVDIGKFSDPLSAEHLIRLRERYGKKEGDVFLFTASRLVLSRGVEDVIGALPFLPSRVKLFIAGDGEDRDKLIHIARGLGVENRVIFAGQVPHEDLPALLHISDIFVRPSLIEGMGSAFIEAFASGIPVVATPVGGIPDFLTDGVTGLFCEVRDPKSIADAVEKYLADPSLAGRVIVNAKKLAVERYDWRDIATAVKTEVLDPLTRRG